MYCNVLDEVFWFLSNVLIHLNTSKNTSQYIEKYIPIHLKYIHDVLGCQYIQNFNFTSLIHPNTSQYIHYMPGDLLMSVGWWEIMIQHTPSIICDFHIHVDFRLGILFPHIFWFLHQNWVGIGGFTLTKLRQVGDEEKTIPSCLDTRSPMIAPPVLPQSAFCAVKKTDWPKLDRFKFLILDILSARRVSAELHLLDQSIAMWSSGI